MPNPRLNPRQPSTIGDQARLIANSGWLKEHPARQHALLLPGNFSIQPPESKKASLRTERAADLFCSEPLIA